MTAAERLEAARAIIAEGCGCDQQCHCLSGADVYCGCRKDAEKILALTDDTDPWLPIETAPKERAPDGARYGVLLIGPYPSGTTHTDVYHSWWDEYDGTWVRWPHEFPPSHWHPATVPGLSAYNRRNLERAAAVRSALNPT